MSLHPKPLMLSVFGFVIGFAATAMAQLIQPMLLEKSTAVKEPMRILADQPPVRIVGPPLVLNINPREH